MFLLACAFLAGLCLAGLPQWLAFDDGIGFLDPLAIAGLAGLSALAMMLVAAGIATPMRAWLLLAPCLPLAVAAGIALAIARDAAPRDMWALEFAAALVVGVVAVLPGILAGRFARYLQNPRRS